MVSLMRRFRISQGNVKDADREIVRHLKETGALYEQDVIVHSCPSATAQKRL